MNRLIRILVALGAYAVVFIVTAAMAVVLLEWMVGCGETYVDSKGQRHVNECLFIQLR